MTESQYQKDAEKAKVELAKVSPTFCRAKWKQVTIHLHNGMTHSCHHPAPHKVPLEELALSPSALHNTAQKNRARMDLLNGVQTKECSYCWNVENANPDALSDRHFKSGEPWAAESEAISLDNPQLFGNPAYVEVAFSSVCNFACSYCSPQVSSKWVEDIKAHGPYDLPEYAVHSLDYLKQTGMMPIPEREENPYVDAFWKWWPELYPSLKSFRITGGEPLLSKHTWRVLDYIDKNPRPDLELSINTNLGVPFKFIERLVELGNRFIAENKVKAFEIYTSTDSWGEQAAYIRDPMDFPAFEKNLRYVLDNLTMVKWRSKVVIMCTYNLLSIPGFKALIDFCMDWRKGRDETDDWRGLWLDISYLRYPDWQTVRLATPELIQTMEEQLAYLKANARGPGRMWGAQDVEIVKFSRMLDWAKNTPLTEDERTKQMRRFYMYFTAYDRRRGRDFVATYPELASFWASTKRLSNA